jgi:hypothetical protein
MSISSIYGGGYGDRRSVPGGQASAAGGGRQSSAASGHGALHSENIAKLKLVNLLFKFQERQLEIKNRVYELYAEGYSIPEIEFIVTSEYDELGPQILAEREERLKLIRDPRTRGSVEPKTDVETVVMDIYARVDQIQAEGAAKVAEVQARIDALCARSGTICDEMAGMRVETGDILAETRAIEERSNAMWAEIVAMRADAAARKAAAKAVDPCIPPEADDLGDDDEAARMRAEIAAKKKKTAQMNAGAEKFQLQQLKADADAKEALARKAKADADTAQFGAMQSKHLGLGPIDASDPVPQEHPLGPTSTDSTIPHDEEAPVGEIAKKKSLRTTAATGARRPPAPPPPQIRPPVTASDNRNLGSLESKKSVGTKK